MPTRLLPEAFVSWRIICLEGNAAICPQRLPLARAIGRWFHQAPYASENVQRTLP